ncbi:hypothetical protein M3J09_006279 [Ascochyta lentis]
MTSCSLVAPGLVSQYGGQVPTFSYRQTSHSGDYFGIQITYMNGASTCYNGSPNFTPVIVNPANGYSVDCSFVISSAYSGIYCANAAVTGIPDGVLTVSYKNWSNTQPTPIAYPATFGPSPAPRAVTATAGAVATSTATQTSTVSPNFASTATVYAAGTTETYTNTIIVTQTRITTNTNYVSSCTTPPVISSSDISSSRPAASSSLLSTALSSSSSSAAAPSPSASGLQCPGADVETYAVGSKLFQIVCNYDRDGTSQGLFQPGNGLAGCITLCANTQDCAWSTYYAAQDACYLKFGQGVPNYNTAASGARWVNPPSSSSVVPSPVASSTPASSAIISSSSAASPSSSSIASSTSSSSAPSPSSSVVSSRSSISSAATSSSPSASASAAQSSSRSATPSSTPATSPSSSGTPVSITCPGDNGKTVNTASGAFIVECYVDRAGGDFSTQYPDSGGFDTCIQICANTPTCVDVSYVPNGPCYLKNALGTPNSNSGVWGARSAALVVSSSTASSTAASTATVFTSTPIARSSSSIAATSSAAASPSSTGAAGANVACPGDDGKKFTTSAGIFVIECYIDRNNNDVGPASSNPTSYAGCMNACAATTGCQAVSYVPNGPCYLKNGIGAANTNNGVWGARLSTTVSSSGAASSSVAVSSSSAVTASSSARTTGTTTSTGPAATSSVVCPGSDGQTITTSGDTFLVECDVDRSGNDMADSPVYPGSYESCVAVCARRTGCVDVSYIPNGPCYLKSSIGRANLNTGIIGGKLISGLSSSSSAMSSSVAASSSVMASSTPASSPAATSVASASVQTVTVTTTVSGTGYQCACTPTSRLGSGSASSAVASTSVASSAAASATPAAVLSCPSSDSSTFTSNCGATYAIECYSDRYGKDIPGGTSYTNTLNECVADCDNTDGCVDVSYSPGSPGPCYKKSSIAEIRQNSNIYGARRLTQCKASIKLKLHRKRVVRNPTEPKKKIQKRGVYGPDYTYTQGVTTTTLTTTSTAVLTTTVTTTPANVGTTTRTVYTTASTTATVTNGATVTQTQQATVTTCPAVTRRAVLQANRYDSLE